MIKYNNKTINDWYFDNKNVIKVYKNGAICYYKMVLGGTPSQEPCFAVVNDITQYSDTEFVDAYDKATEKWYKLNNLDQYEEYGVYGEGRNITYYEGKLTVDNGYEYEWDGSEWSNLGEVSGSSVPDSYVIPFDDSTVKSICVTNWGGNVVAGEITYGEAKQVTSLGNVFQRQTTITSFNELAYFHGLTSLYNGEFVGCTNLRDIVIPSNVTSIGYNNGARATFSGCTSLSGLTILSGDETLTMDMFSCNNSYYMNPSHSNIPMCFPDRIMTFGTGTFGYCDYLAQAYFQSATPPVGLANADINNYRKLANVYCPVGSLSAYQTALSGNGKTITEYDFETDSLGLLDKEKEWIAKTQSVIVYPKNYTEKDEPENNVVFEDMEEALAYECPWVGMRAIIGGDIYIFDSNNEWSKVPYYYRVEDVTTSAQGGSGWTITGSSAYNPDLDYYDDYSVVRDSTTYQYKVAKVTIFGYDNFTYYLRSSGYSSNNYVVATNLDEVQTDPTGMTYSNTSAITNTYAFNKAPASDVNLSNYRRVTYNNLDKTVEHTFYVIFYGRTYSSYQGTATLLIPKDQTEENWEQVTFSASTNVGVVQKNLYIDGNNSTSGGTGSFYYRWMIGLPSGSHSSYTNYSNYSYCPSVTSSTFTSVAGGVRQVDYVYNSTTTKNLQFRLVDGSGNTITTGDTVYYIMNMNNGCGASSNFGNLTFPRTMTVTVGGSFYFTNSNDGHYIYGYAPNIQFNTSYYSDNYNTYFDIPYTKLDTEAVTVMYTTYDPNDAETPSFSTKITYPYNGGTTSSTTLTSYDVPYTYPYVVSQTNTMFSAVSQSFTAGQSSRTVTFTLYPNNREFSTVADLEAYQYAWEGMVAYVDDTRYKYENGEWTEWTNALPDVPFILNYNAKNYDATNRKLPKTEGQLRDSDAVCNYGYHIVDHSTDGYITVTGNTRMIISGTPYMNRNNTQTGCTMTIVSKVKTTNVTQSYSILTNRNNNMNWMWRYPSNGIFLHGSTSYNNPQYLVSTTTQPITASIRISYDGSVKQQLNDWTNNGSYNGAFQYGSESTGDSAMFCDYTASNSEFWKGDFYWVYMSFNVLTDEQIQQVIDYNENL